MRSIAKSVLAAIIVVIVVIAGVGVWYYYSKTAPPATTTTTQTTTPAHKYKIAVVYDIGGRGDLSFNDMAYLGAMRAKQELGVDVTEVQSVTEQDYLPNLRTLAQSGQYLVIIAVGFLMSSAVNQTAQEFPNQLFAIIDAVVNQPNVLSVVFKEHEGSALVGALAGMVAHYYNCSAVGVVLGMEIPVLYKFEAGYYWGIRWGEQYYAQYTKQTITPLKILYTYTGSFNDPAKGMTATQAQLAQGACVVYNVAGATGLGIIQAAQQAGQSAGKQFGPPFAIGVDSDQDWIAPGFVIASMEKRVDVGVYEAVKRAIEYKEGKISKYGGVLELGLKEGGVAMSSVEDLQTFLQIAEQAGRKVNATEIIQKVQEMRSRIPSWIWDAVNQLKNQIINNPSGIKVDNLTFADIENMVPYDASKIAIVRQDLNVG
ncbi:BMP family lipoprotein [Thermogladius sp. 4427co]|uniref:BMP family lipoprotein n=1 Tax=Thermogladius sp. 4427co TaxID=3450718 RepID=UPI003F7AD70A